VERVLARIDPRTALSSFLLSLSLVAPYAIVGALVGARILYDLSLPIWMLLFWAVMYTTGRHCIVMRATVRWPSQVCNNTKATGRKGYELCAYFEEKALRRPSTLVGALTYVVSVAYFLVSAKREVLSHIHDRLWETYRCLEARSGKDLSDRNLKELNVEVLTLSKVEADIEKKKVFPFSAESALRLFFSPAISSGVVILREYFRSVTGL